MTHDRNELDEAEREAERITHPPSVRPEVVDALAGMAAGAVTGAVAGPPGILAGILLGGAIGTIAGVASERGAEQRRAVDAQLDEDIGVTSGHIGEASPNAPPALIGAFSAGSMGVSGGGEAISEGPMQNLDPD